MPGKLSEWLHHAVSFTEMVLTAVIWRRQDVSMAAGRRDGSGGRREKKLKILRDLGEAYDCHFLVGPKEIAMFSNWGASAVRRIGARWRQLPAVAALVFTHD